MNSFYEHHKDSINWHYRCFDRIFLNGLIQPFQQPERLICQHLSPRRATPRSLVHTDACDHGSPQADGGNRYNPASASPKPRRNPHSARSTAPAYVPRFRALALFGRRPPQCVEGFVMPAAKNLHNNGLTQCGKLYSYSITTSARASRGAGTSRPSALAVLRLITVSHFVADCTGRSAGFSPLRTRST